MINDILIVDSIQEAISRFGVEQFRDMVLQEQGGSYFFVDIDLGCLMVKEAIFNRRPCDECEYCHIDTVPCPAKYMSRPIVNCQECSRCIKPLPLKIAWFILQATRLQRQAFSLAIPPSNDEIEEIFKRLEFQEDRS